MLTAKKRKNLQTKRKQFDFSQEKTANSIGITTRQYQSLEAGTSEGSMKVWEKLKNLFNESIDYLSEKSEPHSNQQPILDK
jgi:DNA-binding XRE family transcriptional regulator